MGRAIEEALGLPTKVLNDAEVAGAGAITGRGLEMIITLGTGLGNAVFDGGALAPHVEVSQGPVRWGLTYDDYIGEHERLRLGDTHWSRRVRRVVDGLRPMYMWDRLYVGGGNSKRITASNLHLMGDDVIVVPNDAGIIGGVRAWELGACDACASTWVTTALTFAGGRPSRACAPSRGRLKRRWPWPRARRQR